ncbi:MAG TPA: endonuclease [Bdellovibrionales bacterium]|nr:endonuclease [Bdellovibrionales bacterium]
MRTLWFTTCLLLTTAFQPNAEALQLSPRFTEYPSAFYQHVEDGAREQALRQELHAIMASGHVNLGYTGARRLLFGELHLLRTGQGYAIRDVYCRKLATQRDFKSRPPAPGQIPDPAVLNAEHTWPQSKFSTRFPRDIQKADLHILYPVLSRANSSRGNLEFGDVAAPLTHPCKASRRGYTARGGGTRHFEVPDEQKGDTSRAIFYFAVRYQMPVSELQEDSLKAWHRLDPVDDFERVRNEAIYAKQKVRNPFIDYPELVELIGDF